jgi:hypothetical protein
VGGKPGPGRGIKPLCWLLVLRERVFVSRFCLRNQVFIEQRPLTKAHRGSYWGLSWFKLRTTTRRALIRVDGNGVLRFGRFGWLLFHRYVAFVALHF